MYRPINRRALFAFLSVVLTHSRAKLPAAETATDSKKQRVIVVGAGLAGLAAARALQSDGCDVVVLEARDRSGGRLWTSDKWRDLPLDLGASWIHGIEANPLTELADQAKARRLQTSYERSVIYDFDGKELATAKERRLERLRTDLRKALRVAQDSDVDLSIRDFVSAWASKKDADQETTRLLNFIVSSEFEQEYAGSTERLSTHWFDSAREYDGEDVFLRTVSSHRRLSV